MIFCLFVLIFVLVTLSFWPSNDGEKRYVAAVMQSVIALDNQLNSIRSLIIQNPFVSQFEMFSIRTMIEKCNKKKNYYANWIRAVPEYRRIDEELLLLLFGYALDLIFGVYGFFSSSFSFKFYIKLSSFGQFKQQTTLPRTYTHTHIQSQLHGSLYISFRFLLLLLLSSLRQSVFEQCSVQCILYI